LISSNSGQWKITYEELWLSGFGRGLLGKSWLWWFRGWWDCLMQRHALEKPEISFSWETKTWFIMFNDDIIELSTGELCSLRVGRQMMYEYDQLLA
jgi:hypothetical protein